MKFLYTLLAMVNFTDACDFGHLQPPVPSSRAAPAMPSTQLTCGPWLHSPKRQRHLLPSPSQGNVRALNVSTEIATTIAVAGMRTSTNPSSGIFILGDLRRHDIIEHDGSLSRKDVTEGDVGDFCPEIIYQHLSAFNGAKHVSLPLAALARWNQIKRAKTANPKYKLTSSGLFNSYLESSILFELFKNAPTGLASVDFVKIFFAMARLPVTGFCILGCDTEEERLAAKEGWRPHNILGAFPLAGNLLQLALNTPEDKAPILSNVGLLASTA